ncbi:MULTISPECIES: hypothetical protein [Rhizobium/Agrobacterium group]|uniref:hypothetical protein n=1 Tax=Rhizobium/Agrobacterium group TaxID=227290 RepID=UPI0008DC2879|nr:MULTISPECIES: hypothetical protein [Rhizobium/Agrobacterium group]MCF1436777.1 hypothetical protein [Allorhizobium ampelinum]MCF1464935.1 hypothetical protein [Allorhizobium ampelinum]MCF1495958.1 hypothetical protein [Allorhizobium ampelinum]MUO92138.1 hypothetical protein [Agrobacterium vitis]MUZ55466.1 hypothetical protein [Agrobacterium vitis]
MSQVIVPLPKPFLPADLRETITWLREEVTRQFINGNMSAPYFNRSMWTLVTHNVRYALLRDARNELRGMVAVFADGEWEHHDQGDYDAMARAYQTLSVRAGQVIGADPPKKGGIGHDSFDAAFPHRNNWEERQSFEVAGVTYALWVQRVRSPFPPSAFLTFWLDGDGDFHWAAVQDR